MKQSIHARLWSCLALGFLLVAPAWAADEAAQTQSSKDTKTEAAADANAKPAGKAKESKKSKKKAGKTVKQEIAVDHIKVQHILIGFRGTVPGKDITRSMEDAKKLAYDILARAQKGEDFDALVKQYTDDQAPGIYGMSNKGVAADQSAREYPREGMVPAFGNVGFTLNVGEIGIADYDKTTSPFGWHIIKRVK